MRVEFEVECSDTLLGEAVFAVGSDAALGAWDVRRAVAMETSEARFPRWKPRAPVLLSGAGAIEFKFAICCETRQGPVRWEVLPLNRVLEQAPGAELTFQAAWSDPKSLVTVRDPDPEHGRPAGAAPGQTTACGTAPASQPPRAAAPAPARGSAHRGRPPRATAKGATAVGPDPAAAPSAGGGAAAAACRGGDRRAASIATPINVATPPPPHQLVRRLSRSFLLRRAGAPPRPPAGAGGEASTGHMREGTGGVRSEGRHSTVALWHPGIAGGDDAKPRAGQPAHLPSIPEGAEYKDVATPLERRQHRDEPGYEARHLGVPVVVVSSELAPWSATGELGLVASSLAYEFAARGHRTMAVSPMYTPPAAEDGFHRACSAWVWLDGRDHEISFYHMYRDLGNRRGCDYVLADHSCFRDRPNGLYCDSKTGVDYEDNLFRFALLCLAAVEAPLVLRCGGVTYTDRVAFLANDWQAALVPVYIAHRYRPRGLYTAARVLFVIHDLAFQGQCPLERCPPSAMLGLDDLATEHLSADGRVNPCRAALACADRVLAVSPSYADEIRTFEGGSGLDEFVRRKGDALRLWGIRSGIDDDWSPQWDRLIARTYCRDSFLEARRECKAALQRGLGLHGDPEAAVVGFVGRLAWEKGADVLGQVVKWLVVDARSVVGGRTQLVMMGDGKRQYREMLHWAEQCFQGRVCGYAGFDVTVEHQIMAGCDILLVPSRREPCGLAPMIAQMYGALPLATATGGMSDSVRGLDEGPERATGFLMRPPIDAGRVKSGLCQALEVFFRQRPRFRQMQRNAMGRDFYWPRVIDEYERHLDFTMSAPVHYQR